jgi:spore germination protein YaaH
MALATGGYDWNGNSVERELTEKQAERIFRSRNIKPVRDADSGVLYGSYLQDGQTHTVWYADAETLRGWMETLRGYGFSKFDFFRLGGNTVEDWNERILYLQGRKSGKEDTEP